MGSHGETVSCNYCNLSGSTSINNPNLSICKSCSSDKWLRRRLLCWRSCVYLCLSCAKCVSSNLTPTSSVMWWRHLCACQSLLVMQGRLGNIPGMTNGCYSCLGFRAAAVEITSLWTHSAVVISWFIVVSVSLCVFQVIANTAAKSVLSPSSVLVHDVDGLGLWWSWVEAVTAFDLLTTACDDVIKSIWWRQVESELTKTHNMFSIHGIIYHILSYQHTVPFFLHLIFLVYLQHIILYECMNSKHYFLSLCIFSAVCALVAVTLPSPTLHLKPPLPNSGLTVWSILPASTP